jgi:uncharacterized protein with ATP-grasp and redox domains
MKQALDVAKAVSSDHNCCESVMRRVLAEVQEFSMEQTPPEMAQKIHRIVRSVTKNHDPYDSLKKLSTAKALELLPKIKQRIEGSENPFEVGLCYAIAGNIMDFGAKTNWDEDYILHSFKTAESKVPDRLLISELNKKIEDAQTILYLGDNAGETVFDKCFIETFPGNAKIFYAVKESPVINDATMVEAYESGLREVSTLISNGTDAPGTILGSCSKEFRRLFDTADLIISKGQGNFETLNEQASPIYFLLQIKCDVIASQYDYTVGDRVITKPSILKTKD